MTNTNSFFIKQKAKKFEDSAEKYVVEFLRCKKSFDYFCEKYILIETPGGDRLLKPYAPQSNLIEAINKDHYIVVLKSRQIGISTIIQAYSTWLCVFYDNAVIGIISKDGKEATDFARAIRSMVEKLPVWMGAIFDKKTEQSFILTNGAKVYASPVNPNAPSKTLRGKAVTFLVIDEAAFIKFLDDAWTSMIPALSTNQMQARQQNVPYGTIVLSTPNKVVGPGKWFYEKYMRAVSGDDIFKPFTIHWRDVDELAKDPDWYRTQCLLFDNDTKKIQQELELKFLSSTGSFFDDEITQKLQDVNDKPLKKLKLFNGEAWIFREAEPKTHYILGVDTAPEHGEDKSAITVWDYITLEQVAEYQGKCKVMDFVKVVKALASQYQGTIVVESNSYGNQIVEDLNNSEFSHMLYREKRINKTVPGLSTNAKTRPLMIDALYSFVMENPECIKSKRLVLELVGLISKPSGRVEADVGCHDDLVLSMACCAYVRKYDPILGIGEQESEAFKGLISDVMRFNDFVVDDINNTTIMREVRNSQGGFINTLDFFGSDRR